MISSQNSTFQKSSSCSHSVPAATLSCLQAVCNAANAPNATPGAELQRSAQDQFVQRRPEIIQQVVARVRPRRAMADAHFEGGRGDQQWPAHHEVRGFLTLRLHPDDRDGMRKNTSWIFGKLNSESFHTLTPTIVLRTDSASPNTRDLLITRHSFPKP